VKKKYLALLDEGWERGSHTFAELGLENAEKLQAKAYLRAAVLARIAALEITQSEAARRIGIPQPKLSNLMADAAPRGFSSDKLMEFALKLGLDIEIRVRPSRSQRGKVIVGGSGTGKAHQSKPNRRRAVSAA
jgi:predicted XRE-type DNA-binding protein